MDEEAKLNLLKQKKYSDLDDYIEHSGNSLNYLLPLFHFGHFNRDDSLDLMLTGNFGGEAVRSMIYIEDGGEFTKICSVGNIDRLEYGKYDIPRIISHYPPCCADIIHTIGVISPRSNTSYGSEIRYYYNHGTEIPDAREVIGEIRVLNPDYYLRTSPTIDNMDRGSFEPVGNIAHTFHAGDEGTAYESQKDSEGRTWYFVVMKNPEPPDNVHFPEEGSLYLGWISGRYLEVR